MPLDPAQVQKIEGWFQQHNIPAPCPICGAQQYDPEIVGAATLQGGKFSALGGPAFAVLALTCGGCAHVRLFNAAAMGLFGP